MYFQRVDSIKIHVNEESAEKALTRLGNAQRQECLAVRAANNRLAAAWIKYADNIGLSGK